MRVRIIYLSFYFCLFFSIPVLKGQSPDIFKKISIEQGLSNNRITSITQDNIGFIWIGTKNGLNKYDGNSFREYNRKNSKIASDDISVLHVDRKGRIWIGTIGGGINKYDPLKDSFEVYRSNQKNKNSISSDDIHAITEDKSGNIWIGTDKGLSFFVEKSKTFKTYTYKLPKNSALSDISVWSILEGKDNNLWIGTYNNGLYKFNYTQKIFTQIIPTDKSQNKTTLEFINTLMFLNENELLIGTNGNGLIQLNIKNNTISNSFLSFFKQEIPIIRTLKRDKAKNIWVGTDGNGLLKISNINTSNVTIKQYKNDNRLKSSLVNNTVNIVFEDNQSNIWVGTAWKGINVVEKQTNNLQFYYSDGKGYNASPVLSVFKEGPFLWIGTDGNGLNKYNLETQKITEYNSRTNISVGGDFIQCIKKRKDGQFWIGTFANGFSLFDSKKGIIKHYKRDNRINTSLPYNDVRAICELPSGDLWIGTWGGGLSYLENNKKEFLNFRKNINNPNSISSDNVISLLIEDQGLIWIGTYGGGLNLFNPKTKIFTHYMVSENDPKSISSNYITSLLKDNKGNLWLATKEGLNKYNIRTREFKKFEIGNTTNTNTIVSLIDDNEGNIWMGTKGGIFKYNIITKKIEELDCPSKEFHFNSVFKDAAGLLYFGGVDGVVTFNPKMTISNEYNSKVVFTDFKLFDKSVPVGETEILKHHVSSKKDIILNYNQSVITFEFSSLKYPFNKKQYAIKMEGFEKNWREIGSQKSATYTNLSPGNYTFNVRTQNVDKTWNDNDTAKINIEILPPIWRTWKAYTMYFILLILIFLGTSHYYLAWIDLNNNLRLEKLQREQEDRLHELKQRFFTNISHEIRTPLTLIIGTINNLMRGNFNAKEQKQLAILKSSTGRLMNLVSELLNIRKLETGNLKLHVGEYNLVLFVHEIFLAFSQHAIANNIVYIFKQDEENIIVWFDKIQLEKAVYNLLTNAFKFTASGNQIIVKVKQEGGSAKIIVEDNGQGIPKDKLSRIFERFYQNEDSITENLGFGIGLSIVKDIVELHSGSIRVKSTLGKGSRFIITIPLGNSHFQKEQIILDINEVDKLINYNKATVKEDSTDKEFANSCILIVEDNTHLLEYLTDVLSQDFKVIGAANGKIGLDIANEKIPDLIVSDVMMPIMDGISLCYELKKGILTSHIPVILLTARTMVENIMEGLEMGADDYLVKPFNEDVLKVRIKNLLTNRRKLREKYFNQVLLNPKEIAFTSPDQEFLSKLNNIIEENIDVSEFSIDQLSSEMAMSHSNLYKKIKALTGMTTVAFIRDFRLKRAAQFLKQNNLSVIDVCFKVGYTDRRHFSQEFKKKFGKSPSSYANETNEE